MLDINQFREDKGGNPEVIRTSQKARYADVTLVDKVIDLDTQWRAALHKMEGLKREFNLLNKEIGTLKKAKKDATELQEKSKKLKADIQEAEEATKDLAEQRDKTVALIGNIVHHTVDVSNNEDDNAIVSEFVPEGGLLQGPELISHYDLIQLLDIVETKRGTETAGGRGYYLKREACLLNQALITYALQFAYQKGMTPVHTPFFMRKEIMAECAQLDDFDEQLYKVSGEGEDKYLIATSEQTLCALHRADWFEKSELPVKYVGFSTCFRKEAGSHGRDTAGIFRVHQFEKVEQFAIVSPHGNTSWEMFEEMISNSKEFYESLGLPYRVVNIVSGELNNAASKKYDLEAWFPASSTYRELVSCSNCLDYQARRLDIRLRTPKAPTGETEKEYVHMLNSTLTATERTICCILENYQTPEGVRVPEVLRPFMLGIELIPFRKTMDKQGKLVDIVKPNPTQAV